MQLTVQATQLKAVRDVPLLPVAGKFFEGREFPTGDVTKMVRGCSERVQLGGAIRGVHESAMQSSYVLADLFV